MGQHELAVKLNCGLHPAVQKAAVLPQWPSHEQQGAVRGQLVLEIGEHVCESV